MATFRFRSSPAWDSISTRKLWNIIECRQEIDGGVGAPARVGPPGSTDTEEDHMKRRDFLQAVPTACASGLALGEASAQPQEPFPCQGEKSSLKITGVRIVELR